MADYQFKGDVIQISLHSSLSSSSPGQNRSSITPLEVAAKKKRGQEIRPNIKRATPKIKRKSEFENLTKNQIIVSVTRMGIVKSTKFSKKSSHNFEVVLEIVLKSTIYNQ